MYPKSTSPSTPAQPAPPSSAALGMEVDQFRRAKLLQEIRNTGTVCHRVPLSTAVFHTCVACTETSYVNHLLCFRDLYVAPLESRDEAWKVDFLKKREVAVFFSTIEQIVQLNTQFLAEINRRVWAGCVPARVCVMRVAVCVCACVWLCVCVCVCVCVCLTRKPLRLNVFTPCVLG